MSTLSLACTIGEGLLQPDELCRAIVVVPARNEENSLAATLDSLRLQVGCDGQPLEERSFEVLLLLNNCTDASLDQSTSYAVRHPGMRLHVMTCELEPERAHVGTARRMLMDLACERLELVHGSGAILSTDADTLVAPDWIARNLAALEAGAEVVGGVIHLPEQDFQSLAEGVQTAYLRDRRLQTLVAELESLLDPDPHDPWPRHLEHFGASLACTTGVYRRSGGLPPVKPLEDVAFIDALRKVGAKIRHAPEVHIYTSARMDGRAEVGLSGQLRHWQEEASRGLPHVVDSAEWMEHRFSTLGKLRRFHAGQGAATEFPERWRERLLKLRAERLAAARFLELLDCNRMITEMFEEREDRPVRHAEICGVLGRLEEMICRARAASPAARTASAT